MIYFPERKKTISYWNNNESLLCDIWWIAIFSLCWPLILLHHIPNRFFSISFHVFSISAGSQLTLYPKAGQTWPRISPPPPPSVDLFQEALDPGNCPFFCRTQEQCSAFLNSVLRICIIFQDPDLGSRSVPWCSRIRICKLL